MRGPAFAGLHIVECLDAADPGSIRALLLRHAPQVVLNAVGVIKQIQVETGAAEMVRVNALFPHELHAACTDRRTRLIHFSTDCVFSGRAGPYGEDAAPDPDDLYGRTSWSARCEAPER